MNMTCLIFQGIQSGTSNSYRFFMRWTKDFELFAIGHAVGMIMLIFDLIFSGKISI